MHSAGGREEGVTEEQIFALGDYRESDAFSEVERLVLDYALTVSATPVLVPDELFKQPQEHSTEAQLVELTAVVAFENYLARLNRGSGVVAEGVSEGAICPIPDHQRRVTGGRERA